MRLLMIDDDESLADAIAQHLIKQHYAVDIATNGQMGLQFVALFNYDLIILDLMLPDVHGRALCQRIRQNHQMPILMLTAQDNTDAKVAGLDAGADDYIVKPIHLPELLARVRALLRRTAPTNTPQLQWGALTLDPSSFDTTYDQHPVSLTPKEYAILELFLRHPHNSQTLDAIIDNIWALESSPSLYAIRTHVKSLRQKLKDVGAPSDFIETLYGFGYRLNPIYETYSTAPDSHCSTTQLNALTHNLWIKHKDEMEARIAILDQVARAAPSLTSDLQQDGIMAAHKLAGSLGCFDFHEGSQLAKKIERVLTEKSHLDGAQTETLQQWVQQLRQSVEGLPSNTSKQLLIHSWDTNLIETLIEQQHDQGLDIVPISTQSELVTQLDAHPMSVVLLDIADASQCLESLDYIKQRYPQSVVEVILRDGDWRDRIHYIQQGASRIFQTPIQPNMILETAQKLHLTPHPKVLIVDEDTTQLSVLERRLEPLGFEISTLSNTLNFWSKLQQTHPDVLVLDVDLPEINGLELCQILRADPHWTDLPILVLTSHDDSQTEDHAFSAGADDFISKGFPIDRLALRIHNRLRP